jgi:hypothetical protein
LSFCSDNLDSVGEPTVPGAPECNRPALQLR